MFVKVSYIQRLLVLGLKNMSICCLQNAFSYKVSMRIYWRSDSFYYGGDNEVENWFGLKLMHTVATKKFPRFIS
jgi:hypothetical protein